MNNLKSAMKKAFAVGCVAEFAAIGGSYYVYRKFKTDEGKWKNIQDKRE